MERGVVEALPVGFVDWAGGTVTGPYADRPLTDLAPKGI